MNEVFNNEYAYNEHQKESWENYKDILKKMYGKGTKEYQQALKAIAPVFHNKINTLITNASTSTTMVHANTVYRPTDRKRNILQHEKFEAALETYKWGTVDAFHAALGLNQENAVRFLTKKSEDTQDIKFQSVPNRFNTESYNSLMEAYNNIYAQKGFVSYDLETLSGRNKFGQMHTTAITDFSFRHAKLQDDGTWDYKTHYSSIIGTSESEYQAHLKLLEKYKHPTGHLSEEERVILERYALTGSSNTVLGSWSSDGVINYERFAGPEDIKGMDYEQIRTGIERLREIGRRQENSWVNYKGVKMHGWEAQLMSGLEPVLGKDAWTLTGHNIIPFDNPALLTSIEQRFGGKMSDGAAQYFEKISGGVFNPLVYDTTSLARLSEITKSASFASADLTEAFKEHNLGYRQQEALVMKYLGKDYYERAGAAHTSYVDTKAHAELITSKMPEEMHNGILAKYKNAPVKTLKKGQLFVAGEAIRPDNFGLWGFRNDESMQAFRTIDGTSVDIANGAVEQDIEQWLFRKNGLYEVTNVSKLNENADFRKFLGGISPDLQQRNLYSVTFNLYTENADLKKQKRAMSSVTVVGTKQMISNMVGSSMYHAFDRNGNEIVDANDEIAHEALQVVHVKNDPKTNKKTQTVEKMSKEGILRKSDFAAMANSAGRDSRERKYTHDTAVLSLAYDAEKSGNKEKFIDNVMKKTLEVRKKINANKGKKLSDSEIAGSLFAYAGYDHYDQNGLKELNKKLYGETAETIVFRINEAVNQKNVIHAAIEMARKRANLNPNIDIANMQRDNGFMNYFTGNDYHKSKNIVNAYYMEYKKALEDAAITLKGKDIGMMKSDMGVYAFEGNKFAIDLNGFGKINEQKKFNIDLDSSGSTLAKRLMEFNKEDRYRQNGRDYTIMKEFAQFLHKSGLASENFVNSITKKDTIESAGKKILDLLRERKKDYTDGFIGDEDTTVMNILHSHKNLGLSDEELKIAQEKAWNSVSKKKIVGNDFSFGNYVDKVLFGGKSDEYYEKVLKDYGYDEKQINFIIKSRGQRRKDTVEYIDKLFGTITRNGGYITYDEATRQTAVGFAGETHIIKNLPMEVFENGIFHTQIDRSKTTNMIGWYNTGYGEAKIEFGSRLKKATATIRKDLNYRLWNASNNTKDFFEVIDATSKRVAGVMREATIYSSLNAKEANNMFSLSMDELLLNINKTPTALDNIRAKIHNELSVLEQKPETEDKEELATRARRKTELDKNLKFLDTLQESRGKERLNTYERLFLSEHLHEILDAKRNDISDLFGIGIEEINAYNKHFGDGIVQTFNTFDALEALSPDKRNVNYQLASARAFNLDKASTLLKNEGIEDVQFGSLLRSKLRANLDTNRLQSKDKRLANGITYATEKVARMSRLAMSTNDFHFLVSNSDLSDFAKEKLMTVHLDEGAGALDPRVIDAMFSSRSAEHSVAEAKEALLDSDGLIADAERKRLAREMVDVKADGTVSFKHGDGFYVDIGDNVVSVNSNNRVESYKSKMQGIVKVELTAKEGRTKATGEDALKVLQAEVERSLKQKLKNEKRKQLTKDEIDRAIQECGNVLRGKYDFSYYVHSMNQITNPKMGVASEKGMLRGMYAGLGTLDSNIKDFFQRNGLTNMLSEVINISYLEELGTKDFKDTMLAKAMTGRSREFSKLGKNIINNDVALFMARDNYAAQLSKNIEERFGSIEGFKNAIMAERYGVWNEFKSNVLQKHFGSGGQFIHAITNTGKAEGKHKVPRSSVMRTMNALYDKYTGGDIKKNNEALMKIKEDFKNIITRTDGEDAIGFSKDAEGNILNLTLTSNEGIEVSESNLNKLVKAHGIDGSVKPIEINGREIKANIVSEEFRQLDDYNLARIYEKGNKNDRGVKFTHRNLTVLEMNRMTDLRKENTKNALINVYGKSGEVLFDKYIANIGNGAVAQGALDTIKKAMFVRPEDERRGNIARFNDKTGKLDFENRGKIIEKMQEVGIGNKTKSTDTILDEILAQSRVQLQTNGEGPLVDEVGFSYVLDKYESMSELNAREFNRKNNYTEKEALAIAKRNGAEVIKLEDLQAPKGGFFMQDFENTFFNKEIIIDTHLTGFSDSEQLHSVTGENRFLYVPHAISKPHKEDAELARTEYQSKIASVVDDFQALMNDIHGGDEKHRAAGEEDRQKRFDVLKSKLNTVRELISRSSTGKNSTFASLNMAEMTDSGMFTAYGHSFEEYANAYRGIPAMRTPGKDGLLLKTAGDKILEALEDAKVNNLSEDKALQNQLAFDYQILSKSAMRRYYGSENFLNEIGIGDALEGKFSEAMEKYFNEGGTTYGLNDRAPQGYFKSTSVAATSFSDAVDDDAIIVGHVGMESKKGDYDSDKVSAALLKAKATITVNGKEHTAEIDYAAYEVLNSMNGVSATWLDDSIMHSHGQALLANASNNMLWYAKAAKINDADLNSEFTIQKMQDYTIEGTADGTLAYRKSYTAGEAADLSNKYDKMLESFGDKTFSSQADERAAIWEKFGSGAGKYSTAEVFETLQFATNRAMDNEKLLSNVLKAGAGEMNYSIFSYLRLAQNSDSILGGETMGDIMHAHIAIGESFLSPKNEKEVNPNIANDFSTAIGKAFRAMNSHTPGEREDAYNELKGVVKDVLLARKDKELIKTAAYDHAKRAANGGEVDIAQVADTVAGEYASLALKVDTQGVDKRFYDLAITRGFSENSRIEYSSSSSEMTQQTLKALQEQSAALGRGNLAYEVKAPKALSDRHAVPNHEVNYDMIDESRKVIEAAAARERDIQKMAVKIAGKNKLLQAGISIAGGLFVAGLANDPTKSTSPAPATTQAAGAQEEQIAQYQQVPSFSDSSLDSMRGGPSGGYVININAGSDQGQQYAMNAINTAINSGVPQTSTMNVSVNTSYKDQLSRFQLGRMIANSLS